MNKKLVVLIGALAATVLALGAAGTGAWFNDSESVQVNASSGKLDVQLNVSQSAGGLDCLSPVGTADLGVPVLWTISNAAPGDTLGYRCVSITNKPAPDSTLATKFRFRSGDSTNAVLFAAMSVLVVRGACVGNALDTSQPYDYPYNGPLSGLDGSDLDGAGTFTNPDGSWDTPLNPGSTSCYAFQLYVPGTVGNGFQGQSGSFSIVGDATQTTNPGW